MAKIKFLTLLIALLFSIESQSQNIEISSRLHLRPIAENVYMHTSYLTLDNGIEFPCNGLVYVSNERAYLIDTPFSNELTAELIDFIENDLNAKVMAAYFSHTHEDAMGGIEEIQSRGIYNECHKETWQIAKQKNLTVPENWVKSSQMVVSPESSIFLGYYGPAHSEDNSVFYLEKEKILFGGCMIKSVGSDKGNIEDADLSNWSETVDKVANAYPDAQIIIPGHGEPGGRELFDYTIELFKN